MNIINIAGLIIISSLISVSLKKYTPEYAMIINIITGAIVISIIITALSPVFGQIKMLFSCTKIPNEYQIILLKALGISVISQFAHDCCIDANEKLLASQIEFAGKIGILICALPLFERIIQTALSLMEK